MGEKRAKLETKQAKPSNGQADHTSSLLLVLLLAGILLAFAPSLLKLNWDISDKDASSFTGVILLMVFVQLAFFNKEKFSVEPSPTSLLAGSFMIALAIVLLAIGPSKLTVNFWLDRYDFIAFPLFIAGSLSCIYGLGTLKRLWFVFLYSFAAWPVLSRSLLDLEPFIASATAKAVYIVSHDLLGLAVSLQGATTITCQTCGTDIIIAPECVAISAVAGLLGFIIPLAYYLKGKSLNRIAWVLFGAAAIEILNVVRISAVVYLWYNEGMSQALSLFHSVSGNILFNATVLLMLLSYPLFKLAFPELRGIGLISNFIKVLGEARKSIGQDENKRKLLVPLVLFAASVLCIFVFDYLAVQSMSWLPQINPGQAFAIQAAAADLPFDYSWDMLGYETYAGSDTIATKFIFARPDASQVQVVVYSSANESALHFNVTEKLISENFSINSTKPVSIQGVPCQVTKYAGNGAYFTTVSWSKPYIIGANSTFLAIMMTEGNYEGYSTVEEARLLSDAENFLMPSRR